MTEAQFMDIVRRALLMIVSAIEKRYGLGKVRTVEILEGDSISIT